MNARDELQMTIFRSNRLNTQVDLQSDRRLEGSQLAWAGYAASAVRAAGYRKPRTVTAVEELDALPAKSAILDAEGTPWVGDGDPVEPWGSVCEDPFGGPIWRDSRDIPLPATVLYAPEPTL